MKNRKLFGAACATFALMATLSATSTLTAQTKAETKLYNTTIAKGDLKNANKFLAKFPSSTYAPKIQRLKDSLVFNNLNANDVLAYISFVEENPTSFFKAAANKKIEELNTSNISDSQALEAALQAGLQKEEILAAKGVKNRIFRALIGLACVGAIFALFSYLPFAFLDLWAFKFIKYFLTVLSGALLAPYLFVKLKI